MTLLERAFDVGPAVLDLFGADGLARLFTDPAHWMGPLCQLYLSLCEELSNNPDAELLGPIEATFHEMNSSGEGE